MRRVLISIKPSFTDMIFRSDKTVELRKKIPALSPGDELLVYASSPVMAIIGAVEVVDVVQQAPKQLWRLVKAKAGVERTFYDEYYQGSETAYGIFLGRTRLFDQAVPLTTLRTAWPRFAPPQNYRYLEVWDGADHPLVEAPRIIPVCRDGAFGIHVQPRSGALVNTAGH